MDKNNLLIEVFRISPDSKFLEIDVTCDDLYTYTGFKVYDYKFDDKEDEDQNKKPTLLHEEEIKEELRKIIEEQKRRRLEEALKDPDKEIVETKSEEELLLEELEKGPKNELIWDVFPHLLTDEKTGEISKRQLFRIPLEDLNGPSMYYAEIEIINNDQIGLDQTDSREVSILACSDVSSVYYYLLNGLLNLRTPCDPCNLKITQEIQRAFLILYAHIEAMRLERWEEAEMFYNLIKANFANCYSQDLQNINCNCMRNGYK